ncbi:MAG: asparagine--tRNA ligase [Candidatus Norongarragalinales archaeon]
MVAVKEFQGVIPIEKALALKDGADATIRGWIHRTRSSGGVVFAVVRDATGLMQVTIKKSSVSETQFAEAERALVESSVVVEGKVREDKRAPGGKELQASAFKLIHAAEPFPITKDQSPEFLLDVRHLWLRSQHLTNIMKARHWIVHYLREFFDENEFYEIAPPIFTKAGCEGGSTLFEVDYFGDKVYLTQSGQLYNEAFITALERVFILAPSFRAEKSRTTKHLTEYWHLEEEAAWFDNEDNMRLEEELVSYACHQLAKKHGDLLAKFRKPSDLIVVEPPFPRLSYDDAVKKLKKEGFEFEWGDDFGSPHEDALTKDLDKPLFVYNWPRSSKPFYMAEAGDGKHVLNADLLAPQGHGEIIGGSEREWNYARLVKRMREEGLNLKNYEWYLDLRKYGSVPHSGFGLGIERLIKWMLNLEHIRDAVPFPRVINRAYP